MRKRKLEAEIDYNFSLVGIISPLKEYKFAWLLNKNLDIQLDKTQDIEIEFLKNKNLIISNYIHETEHSSFKLMKNKSVDHYGDNPDFIVPELKRFDYIIVVQGFEDLFSDQELKNMISSITSVQYVQLFSVESLKSKENLIF